MCSSALQKFLRKEFHDSGHHCTSGTNNGTTTSGKKNKNKSKASSFSNIQIVTDHARVPVWHPRKHNQEGVTNITRDDVMISPSVVVLTVEPQTSTHCLARWAPTGTPESPIDQESPVIFCDRSCCQKPKYELAGVDATKTTTATTISSGTKEEDSKEQEEESQLPPTRTPDYKESDQWKGECSTSSSLCRLLVAGAGPGALRGTHHQTDAPKGQEEDRKFINNEEKELKRQNCLALLDEVESSMATIKSSTIQQLHDTTTMNGTPLFRQSRKSLDDGKMPLTNGGVRRRSPPIRPVRKQSIGD